MSTPRVTLDPRLPPGRAARAAALALVDAALAQLRRGDARAVHQARRACKQLRALLRLLKPQLGARYAPANAGVRDAARVLSAGREATVLGETARALSARHPGVRPVARLLRGAERTDGRAVREARRRLREQRGRIARWRLAGVTPAQVPDELRRGYRRGRAAFRAARRSSQAAELHEWRKQAKYHRNQLALVASLWPQGRARLRALDALSDLLGWHHDLQVLDDALARLPPGSVSPRQLARARRRAAAEQERAARAALELGATLFADRAPDWLKADRP